MLISSLISISIAGMTYQVLVRELSPKLEYNIGLYVIDSLCRVDTRRVKMCVVGVEQL